MNVGFYITELLYSKQSVALPGIGSFELVSKPAQIDSENGTITPPSKTIKFKFGEDTGFSLLATYISKKENIAASNALEAINSFAENILDKLKREQEYELLDIGTLRMLGTGTIIFLPISTYSSIGESFGLPTLNIGTVSENSYTQSGEVHTPVQQSADISQPVAEDKPEVSTDEDIFELIDESEESSTEPAAELQAEVKTEDTIPAEQQPVQEEVPSAPVYEEIIDEPIKIEAPQKPQPEPVLYTPTSSPLDEDSIVEVEKSRFSWIWMFLVVLCVLAISLVALYHYNPSLFAFLNWNSTAKVAEPKVPSDLDTTYYKAITGTLKDSTKTDSVAIDSARIDSARANLKKIDSIAKVNKQTAKPTTVNHDRPMTKEEMENLINEKLKLGNTASKGIDTQQKAKTKEVAPAKQDAKATAPKQEAAKAEPLQTAKPGGYNVIAASVRTQAEMQKEVAHLKSMGFNPIVMEDGKGKIRISIGSYPNPRAAAIAAREAKTKLGVDAWVLNP